MASDYYGGGGQYDYNSYSPVPNPYANAQPYSDSEAYGASAQPKARLVKVKKKPKV